MATTVDIHDTHILVTGDGKLTHEMIATIRDLSVKCGFKEVSGDLAEQYGCALYLSTKEHIEEEKERIIGKGGLRSFDIPEDVKPVCHKCGDDSFYEKQVSESMQNIWWNDELGKYTYDEPAFMKEMWSKGIYCSNCDCEIPRSWFRGWMK